MNDPRMAECQPECRCQCDGPLCACQDERAKTEGAQ